MKEYTSLEVESIVQETLADGLESVLRAGARKMLQAALEYEVSAYIARFQNDVDEQVIVRWFAMGITRREKSPQV